MADNFLSNDNYYNKGGLNGKPKEPRPSPPKGQLLNNEYEIIIDGVDVSKCCNYDDTQFWECGPTNCHCEELPNCYYKQLKRKEQALDEIEDIYRTDDSGDYDFVRRKILNLICEVKGVN